MRERQAVQWAENDTQRSARWRSESGARPPRHLVVADDRTTADAAYKLACEGTALLWRGDFVGARQLLTALTRRVDRPSRRPARDAEDAAAAFHHHRARQAQRARILGMLLVPLDVADGRYTVPLRRAPDVSDACAEAYAPTDGAATTEDDGPSLVPLRELLGLIGAHEWHRKGVEIPALGGDRVHPRYGVFSPVRGEYVDLVAEAPLPPGGAEPAYDVGTGTGVLSAVLARRGVRRVVAIDQDPRALACARENLARLAPDGAVDVVRADLFPVDGTPARLVLCNPPWLPAKPTSAVERAVYDPRSAMLRGFLTALPGRLDPDGGEGWLILSDLAEHLGLRSREELLGWIDAAGLRVLGRLDTRPAHPRAADPDDPLHAARSAEVTSLWRLARA